MIRNLQVLHGTTVFTTPEMWRGVTRTAISGLSAGKTMESACLTHPAVVECAITAVPDEVRGQVVKATIVLARDYVKKAGPELVREIQNHVKRVTAPYKYPRVVEFVNELPKTISGKIRRVAIRASDAVNRAAGSVKKASEAKSRNSRRLRPGHC